MSRCRQFTVAAMLAWAWLAPVAAEDSLDTTVRRTGRVLEVRSMATAAAPAATCYAVLADFDRLAEFVPGLRLSQVVSAPGEPVRLHQVGVGGAVFFRVTLDVTLAVMVEPPVRLEFERIAGNLRRMSGSWTVSGDALRCVVRYRADIEPAFWVPPLIGPALMRSQVEEQMTGLVAEMHRRAAAARDGHAPG